jgi:hypothetical protein
MEFEENNEEFEGKMTRNLKEKHREFFTIFEVLKVQNQNKIILKICHQVYPIYI